MENRLPPGPNSPLKHVLKYSEEGFQKDFQITASKNNETMHRDKREYFD